MKGNQLQVERDSTTHMEVQMITPQDQRSVEAVGRNVVVIERSNRESDRQMDARINSKIAKGKNTNDPTI